MNESQKSIIIDTAEKYLDTLRTEARLAQEYFERFEDGIVLAAEAVNQYNTIVEGLSGPAILEANMPESIEIDTSTGGLTEFTLDSLE